MTRLKQINNVIKVDICCSGNRTIFGPGHALEPSVKCQSNISDPSEHFSNPKCVYGKLARLSNRMLEFEKHFRCFLPRDSIRLSMIQLIKNIWTDTMKSFVPVFLLIL